MESRFLKQAVGFTLIVGLIACGAMASPASATEFTAASYPVTYSGQQAASEPHVFKADGYEVTCKNAEFSGEAKAASTTMELTPVYTECTAFGLSASLTMNGCFYKLNLPPSSFFATVDLICPAGKDVTWDAGGGLCVMHIPPFTGKSHWRVVNDGAVLSTAPTATGIGATLTDVGGFFCPFSGNTSVENVTYTGNLKISGSSAISVSE